MTGYLGAGNNGAYLKQPSPYFSGGGIASTGSGGGSSFLKGLSGLGAAISPFAPLIGLGTTLIGGLMGNDTEQEKIDAEKEIAAKRLAEDQRQFDLNLGNQKAEFGRNSAFKGLGELANNRQEVLQRQKNAAFRNALYQSMGRGVK
jgi:hypothetical protein